MNWYRTSLQRAAQTASAGSARPVVKESSRITMQKLRRLFDDAAQGMLDEELLDDVYSEWMKHLRTYATQWQDFIKIEAIDDEHEADLKEIYRRLTKAYEEMDRHYTAPPKEKFIILNKAIQERHWAESILAHYPFEEWNSTEIGHFLDWLSARRSLDEKSPPEKKAYNESRKALTARRIRTASRITLQKLRRLFDDAAQGMLDEELLDDVYSEWHAYLDGFASRVAEDMKAGLLMAHESGRPKSDFGVDKNKDLLSRLTNTARHLDMHYADPSGQKFLVLNYAIQKFHNDAPMLAHYFAERGVDCDAKNIWGADKFLDWLSARRSLKERTPPQP